MLDDSDPSTNANRSALSRVKVLVHQLQEVLDNLKMNSEHLAGDLFHHDTLFRGADCTRLDEKLMEVIAELKRLSRHNDE